MFRQGDDYVLVTELPGIERDDVDIQVKGNRVRLAGRRAIDYGEGASLHRRERLAGQFDRSIALPVNVDPDRVQATYRNGVLALFLPQAERDKPRTITIG